MGEDRINPSLGRQGTRIEICLWIGLIAATVAIGLINSTLFEPREKSSFLPENGSLVIGQSVVC